MVKELELSPWGDHEPYTQLSPSGKPVFSCHCIMFLAEKPLMAPSRADLES